MFYQYLACFRGASKRSLPARLKRIAVAVLLGCGALPVVVSSAFATEQTFRDWRTDCDATVQCILSTTVRDASDTWLATLLVAANADDTSGTMMQVLVPTGAHLASGVFVNLGREGPVEAVYQSCAPQACLATLSLGPDDVAALRRNTKARIVYRPRYSTPAVTFDVSLMGFTAALTHARQVRE